MKILIFLFLIFPRLCLYQKNARQLKAKKWRNWLAKSVTRFFSRVKKRKLWITSNIELIFSIISKWKMREKNCSFRLNRGPASFVTKFSLTILIWWNIQKGLIPNLNINAVNAISWGLKNFFKILSQFRSQKGSESYFQRPNRRAFSWLAKNNIRGIFFIFSLISFPFRMFFRIFFHKRPL